MSKAKETPTPAPVVAASASPVTSIKEISEFILIIRSSKGTLHAALDEKRKGPGALATFASFDLADTAAKANPTCKKLTYYILPIE